MAGDPAYLDISAPLAIRVESLLEALTIDEKLILCAGQGAWSTKSVPRMILAPAINITRTSLNGRTFE